MDIDAGPAADYHLPDLTLAEAIETTRTHSVDGLAGGRTAFATVRPFRAPHHAICDVVLIGGDQTPMLGEGSLAHHAVLFLDEIPSCTPHALRGLGRRTVAAYHNGDSHDALSVSPPHPLQHIQPSHAFRLTPGQVWSTRDTIPFARLSETGARAFAHRHTLAGRTAIPESPSMRCPRCEADTPDGGQVLHRVWHPPDAPLPPVWGGHAPTGQVLWLIAARRWRPTPTPPAAAPHTLLRYTPGYLAEKILTSKAALEGERKQVTVLFADLKGSMELLADRDPEDARAILDPVLERMMDAVHRYEGTVNQVMGDGIMALFGAPLAHEDHAVRACYAALRDTGRAAPLQ